MRIKNYGETWSFTPRRWLEPSSTAELTQAMQDAKTVRVMGAKHSWSKGIVTDDTLLSLDQMSRILRVDEARGQVTVQAGIRLKDLIRELEQRGLALKNLGSIASQSLAGATSTGTHGTGIGFRCLADQIEELKLVDGTGADRTLRRGDDDFCGAAVGLGAFGIVHELTLSVVPCFQMHAITETMPWDELLSRLDELVTGHDHFKFWWLVPSDDVIVFRQNRTTEPRNDSDFKRWFKDELLAVGVYRTALALQRLERDRTVALTNKLLGREFARRFERICKSHVAFLTPEPPVHRETEWAFDFANAKDLLREYRRLLLGSGHTYSFIQEIRFTQGDDFWLSPAYGRDSIWLSMYNIDSMASWDDQLRKFESFARAHDGRPHWGKEADFDPEYLRTRYEHFDNFDRARRRYDPDGKLENRWLRALFRR